MVENSAKLVYDTGASRHFCANKEFMQDFKNIIDGEWVYMGNSMIARVRGKGKILLKFTLGKLRSLSNVQYMPSFRRNFVSGITLELSFGPNST